MTATSAKLQTRWQSNWCADPLTLDASLRPIRISPRLARSLSRCGQGSSHEALSFHLSYLLTRDFSQFCDITDIQGQSRLRLSGTSWLAVERQSDGYPCASHKSEMNSAVQSAWDDKRYHGVDTCCPWQRISLRTALPADKQFFSVRVRCPRADISLLL